jgi:hypothetical protein
MPDENEDTILENALAPKRASGDSGSMEQHEIDDQIKAVEYATKRRNSRVRAFPVKFVRIIPPGATGD